MRGKLHFVTETEKPSLPGLAFQHNEHITFAHRQSIL